MKTHLSSNIAISGQELNEILIHVIQDYNAYYKNHTLDFAYVDFSSNNTANEIKQYFIRRNRKDLIRILLKYFTKHQLLTVYKYQDGTDDYKRIVKRLLFKYDDIARHFNIYVKPYFSYHDDNPFKFMSARLSNHIFDFVSNHRDTLPSNQLGLICTQLHYTHEREYNDDYDRHFDLTSDGKLTYLGKKKLTVLSNNGKWLPQSRTQIKFGKGLRKIVGNNASYLTSQVYETFHNFTYSKFHFNDSFEIVSGLDIADAYHGDNYASGSGSLNSSCMRYSECQHYLDIYTENPQIELLISKNTAGKITGRALILKTVFDDNPVTIMDRIYGQDKTIQAFKDYATKNGMLHKRDQNYHNPVLVAPNGSLVRDIVRIPLSKTRYNEYPYMDTFKYIDWENNVITNYPISTSNIKCESTQGNYSYVDSHEDDDYVQLPNGESILAENAGYCEHLDEWHHLDDIHWSDEHNTYLHSDVAIYIESQGDWFHENDDIAMDETTGEYDLLDNLKYSLYDDCYYSDYEECIVLGPVHPDDTRQITLINGDQHYIHNIVTIPQLNDVSFITADDIAYLVDTDQITE